MRDGRTSYGVRVSASVLAGMMVFAMVTSAQQATTAPVYCFAPGTSDEVVADRTQRAQRSFEQNSLDPSPFTFPDGNRWSATATSGGGLQQGDPTILTWSLVPDGTTILGYAGEPTGNSNFRAFLASVYGSLEAGRLVVQAALEAWEEVSGIEYVYEPNDDGAAFQSSAGIVGVRGDIRIGGHLIDGNSGILAYNFYPGDGGDMVLDTADNFYNDTSSNSLKMRNVVTHEAGHGIGQPHTCPVNQTKLMEPFLSTAFDGPQFDEILAANRGYGDLFEHNESVGASGSLGNLQPDGGDEVFLFSADDNGDTDFFSFDLINPGASNLATVTVTPLGSTYLSGPQNPNGTCTAGSPFDALNVHNLAVEVLDTDGATSLALANQTGVGGTEVIADLQLPSGAGSYFVHVLPVSSTNKAQLYELKVEVSSADPFTLLPVDPGGVGVLNSITIEGGTPGVTTFFAASPSVGSTPLPGCAGSASIGPPKVLGSDTSDGSGVAEIMLTPPPAASGKTFFLQAVELSTCRISNRIELTFP